jgi:hypothetical protein
MPRRYEPQSKKDSNSNRKSNNIIVIAVIAAVVIVVGLIALNAVTGTPPTPQVASGTRDWGSPNAPITVIEYSDLQ